MISEGSCDTEDWSNDAENSALNTGINYIEKYIQRRKQLRYIIIMFHIIAALLYFRSSKWSLDEQQIPLKNIKKT